MPYSDCSVLALRDPPDLSAQVSRSHHHPSYCEREKRKKTKFDRHLLIELRKRCSERCAGGAAASGPTQIPCAFFFATCTEFGLKFKLLLVPGYSAFHLKLVLVLFPQEFRKNRNADVNEGPAELEGLWNLNSPMKWNLPGRKCSLLLIDNMFFFRTQVADKESYHPMSMTLYLHVAWKRECKYL